MNATKLAKEGRNKPMVGKEILPFKSYVHLNEQLLKKGIREDIFTKAYMNLSWVLMSRSVNIVNINLPHINVSGDALTIVFVQSKTDQYGKRKLARRVHSNPLRPFLCPVLSLALCLD